VEAAARLMSSRANRSGALTLGAAFDPCGMLQALAPAHFELALTPALADAG
jgi:hypothetical protein